MSEIPSTNRWPVLAEKTALVNSRMLDEERKALTAIAEKYGGEFDGWETEID